MSRFPADEGIVAERKTNTLKVKFVEEVFLKNAYSYKSVLYKCKFPSPELWVGKAVDKQINHGVKEAALYWIKDFLKSEFQTTPKRGTKILANALKTAIAKSSDLTIKHELTLSSQMAKNIPAKPMSIAEYANHFHLPDSAKEYLFKQVHQENLLNDTFIFDRSEFDKHLLYKMIELDNGAVLSAQATKFDDCFSTNSTKLSNSETTFTTTGNIIDEMLRKTK